MGLEVLIESGPDLIVRNNMARGILSVNLGMRGTVANPILQGHVNILEGRVYYSEKEFEITEGYLDYPGEADKKPTLHLSSRVEVRGETRDYVVFLDLDGPLDRITLSLRSIPELEREDVLFVMLTGKTQDEYYSSSTSGTKGSAKQLALTGLSSLFGGDIKAWTGLDTFVMEGTKGKELGVKTTVGKRLNERFNVRGILNIGSGKEVNEARVEYRLTDTLYLVGTQRSDGSFGLDVRIRYQGE
jgi:autotransporter translocation and assembly factor TamB